MACMPGPAATQATEVREINLVFTSNNADPKVITNFLFILNTCSFMYI